MAGLSLCRAGCPVVIDVRTVTEWNEGHLQCAHRLPVQSDASLVGRVQCLAGGKSADPIYVYCRSGARAGSAVTVLQNEGFTTATNKGGYDDVVSLDLCDCTPQNTCAAAPSSSSSNPGSTSPSPSSPLTSPSSDTTPSSDPYVAPSPSSSSSSTTQPSTLSSPSPSPSSLASPSPFSPPSPTP